jgi:hypothetical protein
MQGSLGTVLASLPLSAFVCWVGRGRSRDVRASPHDNVQPCAQSLGRRAFCCTIRVGSKTASKIRTRVWRPGEENAGANGRRRPLLPSTGSTVPGMAPCTVQSSRNTATRQPWNPWIAYAASWEGGELTAVSAARHDAVWGCLLASACATIDEF